MRLVLFRHAQAESQGADLKRSLSERGVAQARRQGEWLAAQARVGPVLVSPALRAQETARLAGLDERQTEASLYEAALEDLLDLVAEHDGPALTLVAHNPGLSQLASWISGDSISLGTADIAVLEFGQLSRAQAGCGRLIELHRAD